MRPVRLEIAGFAAFAEPVVVDFAGVELAALVGPTGSGKSSVIDAMTFALYGAVARYDQRAVAPVINQLAAEARVRFDFELAGTTYTAVRVVRRRGAGATTKEARLESGGDVLAGDERSLTAAVVELLGLDFDKFNKTVVLPQGRFAEFLHDKPADRQELLRGLLGIGVYERIGRLARERAAAASNRLDLLDEQLGAAGDVSDEHLAALVGHAETVAAVAGAVESIGTEVDALDAQLAEVVRRVAAVQADRAVVAAVAMPSGVVETDAALALARAVASATASALQDCTERLDAAAAAAEHGPSEAAMGVLLHAHEQLAEAGREAAGAARRVAAAEVVSAAATTAADAARRRRHAAAEASADAERAAAEAVDELRTAGDPGRVGQLLDLHPRHVLAAAAVEPAEAAAMAADDATSEARDGHGAALDALALAQRLAPAAALAAHLVVGESCPVCDRVVEALPGAHCDHAAAVAEAGDAERAAARALAAAEARQRECHGELAARRATLAAIGDQLAGEADVDQLTALAARLAALSVACDEARAAALRSRADLAAIDADPATAQALAAEASAGAELAAARAVHQRAQAAQSTLAEAVAGRPDREAATLALAEARRLAEERTAADAARRAAAAERTRADTALAAAEQHERLARQAYDEARERVAAREQAPLGGGSPLPARTGGLADDWAALVGWAMAAAARLGTMLDAARAAHDALASQRAARAAELDAVLVGVPGASEPGAPIDVGVVRRRLDALLVDARAQVKATEAERARVAAVRRDAVVWRERAAVAGMLGNLLRADAFERWLLDEALADLVARANVRLGDLTAGQYTLAAVDGAFRVVDHRNADDVRDARSLSGGETFLTSLALALALADSSVDAAAQGGEPIESIFLDEGFGTLDPDTLDVVAGTIEELGAGGRMVGIITHIRELAERMPTRFEITKGPRTSVIERVDV